MVFAAVGCGKRGDPLPPLRPFPGRADGLAIRQLGDRIQLRWRAPTRNTDNTTEKLELAEVEVRRRVIDIPALVEAQTEIIEPETPDEKEDETQESEGIEDDAEIDPGAEAGKAPDMPSDEPEPPAGEAEAVIDEAPTADVEASEDVEEGDDVLPEEEAPPTPTLQIPEFGPQSRYVTTFESTEPGAMEVFEEEIDPGWIGKRVEYAVVYTNRSNRRGPRSTTVAIDPVPALVPPRELRAESGDGFVRVSWDHPEPDTSYFSVFRRREDAPEFPETPLSPSPIADSEYRDRSVRFGVATCYTVRTVPEPPPPPPEELEDEVESEAPPEQEAVTEAAAVPGEAEAELVEDTPTVIVPEVPPLPNPAPVQSVAAPEVCLVPTDTFPPPPPTGVVAVRSDEDVLLTWTDSPRRDVIGYRVYRSTGEAGPFEALTDELVRVPSFTDETVESGLTYYYAVTAVDDAPEPNESARSEPSQVTFIR